ncbi:hypothetical protein ABPG72_022255 [Tetrahymena utriculariae]
MKSFVIITLAYYFSLSLAFVHECDHKGDEEIDVYIPDNIHLLSERTFTPAPIRFTFDDSEIQNMSDLNLKNLLLKSIKTAQLFYEDLIIVKKPNPSDIVVTDKPCNFHQFSNYPQQSNSDFHVYIQLYQFQPSSTTIASAQACQLNSGLDNRPELAVVNLNAQYIKSLEDNYYNFQMISKIVIHELFHAIANSPGLYSRYTTQGYYKNNALSFQNILQWARDHYDCEDLIEFPLESHGSLGSKGSHWPRDLLNNDVNTASYLLGNMVWSGINNAMILDSGWYDIQNYQNKSDPISWGLKKGCLFLNIDKCDTQFPEFCTNQDQKDTFIYSGIGTCSSNKQDLDIFATCPYIFLYSNMECQNPANNNNKYNAQLFQEFNVVFGSTSSAFQSNIQPKNTEDLSSNTVLCYPNKCNEEKTKISISFDRYTLTCEQDGQIIYPPQDSNFKGYLTCPRISDFCQKQVQCEDFCSSNGYCLNGKCHCIEGVTGEKCECSENKDLKQPSCNRVQIQNCNIYDDKGNCIKCFSNYKVNDNKCFADTAFKTKLTFSLLLIIMLLSLIF